MTEISQQAITRRAFVRGAALAVPVLGAALALPRALAEPDGGDCNDPNAQVNGCVVQLPEEFGSTSFSTTAVAGGTNYSILYNTLIPFRPELPPGSTGYRIDSMSISGTKNDGAPFDVTPAIGEQGARAYGARSATSLGFIIDHPWTAGHLVRSFAYTFTVNFLTGLNQVASCTYVTAMRLADNGMVVGGVGSVTFAPPRLTACGG